MDEKYKLKKKKGIIKINYNKNTKKERGNEIYK